MKTQSILYAVSLTAALVSAAIIPEDMPDGLISWAPPNEAAKRDEVSESGWTLLEAFDETAASQKRDQRGPPSFSTLARRNFQEPKKSACYDQSVGASDYASSLVHLKDICEDGLHIRKNGILGYKVGSSVAFICNWKSFAQGCTERITTEAFEWIDNNCGSTVQVGWLENKDWGYSYGRALVGDQVCASSSEWTDISR